MLQSSVYSNLHFLFPNQEIFLVIAGGGRRST